MRKKAKICRYIKKPCIQEECEHWVGFPVETINALTKTSVVETKYMCNDLWTTKIAFDAAGLADKSVAAVNDLRNHVAEGNQTFISLTSRAVSGMKSISAEEQKMQGNGDAILPRQ